MDKTTKGLKGSESRDLFKYYHKHKTSKYFYACDADFCLVSKRPPGTVAYLDFKRAYDNVTFSEAIQYNEWMKAAPVFIVESNDPENGPFIIRRYLGADWIPEPPEVTWGESKALNDWQAFNEWEGALRKEYARRGGWNDNLKGAT